MYNKNDSVTKKIFIKNMLCDCCVRLLRMDLEKVGIIVHEIKNGYAEITYPESTIDDDKIDHILSLSGLSRINGREQRIVEELKTAVFELIYKMNNVDSIAQKSEYIVEKLGLNYRYLSNLFSKFEPQTLEKYIIRHKIERIKQLIDEDEYTLSEIAYMMDYSSVQYLSNQFKKETGYTVSEYKNLPLYDDQKYIY
jgi:AraC family transcriptional regulator